MIKKIAILVAMMMLAGCLALAGYADVYEYLPDSDGCYVVEYNGTPSNEYLVIVVMGLYDETNFVEAYNNASDEDILYYEQLSSDDSGKVTFGPFVPTAYFDATIIIGGTDLNAPVLAGYIKTGGISNITDVEITDISDTYSVNGLKGEDVVIDVNAVLIDSFGFPAITKEKAIISVSETELDVTADPILGTVTIDRFAQEGEFDIVATYGDYSDRKTVKVVREESVPCSVSIRDGEDSAADLTTVTLELIEGTEKVENSFYVKTLDQYNDVYEDTHEAYVDGDFIGTTYSFEFTTSGTYSIKFVSVANDTCAKSVEVVVKDVKPYSGNALTLYELIKTSEKESNEILVSADGKDILPSLEWTTQAKKTTFDAAIETAKKALASFDAGEKTDEELASSVTALTNASNSFKNSIKAGIKVSIEKLSIDNQKIRIPVTDAEVLVPITTVPAVHTDKIYWESSDPETVYIDENGYMVAKENGTVIITATTSAGVTASTTVTAYTKATRIYLSESSLNLTYGNEPHILRVSAFPATQTEILTWSSSKPDIATVDQSGKVVPQPKAGRTTITVIGEHGLVSQCEVKVTLPDWETVATPVADVVSGNVYMGTKVSLSTTTENAKIYYTLDGSEPTNKSRPYVGPISVNSSVTLKAIAVCDRMFDSGVVSYDYNVVKPKISVGEIKVVRGHSGELALTLENNPGISNLSVKVTSLLHQPENVKAGDALSSLNFDVSVDSDGGYILTWSGDAADATEGVIATFVYNFEEDHPINEYAVSAKVIEATNAEGEALDVETSRGKIQVTAAIVGDVNGDESVDLNDVILLAQYCAGWPSAIETAQVEAADCNNDESVDIRDVVLLAQYCTDWDVTIG